MRNIILRVPSYVFVVLFCLPSALSALSDKLGIELKLSFVLIVLLQICFSFIWKLSLVDYLSHENKDARNVWITYLMIFLEEVSFVLLLVFGTNFQVLPLLIASAILLKVLVIFKLTKLLRSVFYERSLWWVIFEFLFLILGVWSITDAIQNWEKEKLEDA